MIYLLLIFLFVVLAATVAMFVNAVSFRPPQKDFPIDDGREVTFQNGKKRLRGYLWNETGTRGLLILVHGMGTGVGYHMPEVQHFADDGFRVFAFEYSGYGKSAGHFYGFPQAVSDLKCAIEFIDDGTLPVILLGHSMGGYAVCTVGQCLSRPVSAIVAYAPFYSSMEAITEMTHGIPRLGWLLRLLVLPVQRVLFGRRHNCNGVDGLRSASAPTLILQGSHDDEVSCTGCSLYAHRAELANADVSFRLIENDDSNGHMTVIRKKRTRCVNGDTMQIVDSFLDGIEKTRIYSEANTQEDDCMRIHKLTLKHTVITLLMCLLVLTLFGCGRGNGNYHQVTAVGRVSSQTGTGISSEHKLLDGREQYTIHVPDGEELAVRVSILNQNGSLSLTIGKRDHTPVYTGKDMESGTFTVYLRESGDYSVIIDANNHEGSYSLDWDNSNLETGAGAS